MQGEYVFNSESVTEGHPDKLCDQISDAIMSHYLHGDPRSLVVAECSVSTGLIFLAVKYRSNATPDLSRIVRETIRKVGYEEGDFNAETSTIVISLTEMENGAVFRENRIEKIPAMDQVTCFGFACDHTEVLMPLPIWLAHRLARRLSEVRQQMILPYLTPDGKTQVGVEFRGGKPSRIHSVTLFTSQKNTAQPKHTQLRDDIIRSVLQPVFATEALGLDSRTRITINPAGPLVTGGPAKHSGLTGRKTSVDQYGGFARQSGASLSGKDPSRIERIGVYAARYAAKNVVAAGLAALCEVQLSYSIGLARPVSVQVETYGTARIPEQEIAARVREVFDFRPGVIVRQFRLRELPRALPPGGGEDFYRRLSAYGQVGRTDMSLPWEELNQAEQLGK
jgi:S-adenosylmethionine synthetase